MRRLLAVVALVVLALVGVGALVLVMIEPDRGRTDDPIRGHRQAGRELVREDPARRRDRVQREVAFCQVTDEDGAPADRATVVVAHAHRPAEHLLTDADGRAAWLPPPEGTNVFAVREGVACSRDVTTAGDERITLRLGEGATLTGDVRWTDGRSALDVVVEMSLWKRGYTTEWVTRTDRDGRFAFRGIPPGALLRPQVRHAVDVVQVGDTRSVDAPEWGHAVDVSLVARRPGVAGVRMELEFPGDVDPAATCVVEYLDAEGVRLSSAELPLDNRTRLVLARIRADTPTGFRVTNGPFAGETAALTLADGEERTIPLEMRAAGRLWLRAVTPDGAAAAPPGLVAHLLLEHGGEVDPLQGRGFDENGRVDVTELLPSDAALGAAGARFHVVLDGPGIARGGLHSDRGPNLSLGAYELLYELRSNADVTLDVPLHRPMHATIVTVDAAGVIVPNVELELLPGNGFRPSTVRTDDDGRASVDVLLDTAAAERSSAWKRAKATAVGLHRGVSILEPPGSLRDAPEWTVVVEPLQRYDVRVVDEAGAVVSEGHVESGRWERWKLDEEGRAEVHLRRGETVTYVDPRRESPRVELPEGGGEIVLVATPIPELVLDVTAPPEVLEDEGPSVRVMAWTANGSSSSTHDLTGVTTRIRIRLRGAGSGKVRVQVATGNGYHGTIEPTLSDGPIPVTLEHRK